MKPILLAIDGEPHTEAAMEHAISLAKARKAELVAVHVKDPYLKQFSNEIYAQGREEYLAHVDACLARDAKAAMEKFERAAQIAGVTYRTRIRSGNPAGEIRQEAASLDFQTIVLGRQQRKGLAKLKSPDLPSRLIGLSKILSLCIIASRTQHESGFPIAKE